jgi:hypothetical protein
MYSLYFLCVLVIAVGKGNEGCIDLNLLEWATYIQQATYVLLLHNAEVELWAEPSIDVICDALLELADSFASARVPLTEMTNTSWPQTSSNDLSKASTSGMR